MKKALVLFVGLLSVGMTSALAWAGTSGNVGVSSNYMWRGVTQSNDRAAVSGGLDYAAESGVYAGTWASNLDGGNYELDVYAGYAASTAQGVEYDVGAISYLYPVGDDELDFTEVYASVAYQGVSGEVAYTVAKEADVDDKNDLYYALGYEGELANGVGYGVKLGHYDIDGSSADDYSHYQIALSKGDFSFAVDANDGDDDDPRVSVAWNKSIDF